MTGLDAAREALRDRQGQGARYDAPEAPAEALAWARSGTAYFARKMAELEDAALYRPSRLPGLSRAHVIAEVAYQAREFSLQISATQGGEVASIYDVLEPHDEAIAIAATLPARALRHLFDHTAIHLNVVWRDLPGPAWDAEIPDGPVRHTALARARAVWLGAVDLGNGGRVRDLPAGLRTLIETDTPRISAGDMHIEARQ